MVALVLLVVGWAAGAWAAVVVPREYVAEIIIDGKSSKYTDWSKVMNNIAFSTTDITIRCLADGKISNIIASQDNAKGNTITFDINGHSVEATGYFGARDANMKLIDGATGGEFKMSLTNKNKITALSGTEIEIVSGTYDICGFSVGGTLTISGGKITFHDADAEPVELRNETAKVNVTGGLFKEDNSEKPFSKYFAEGYKAGENVTMGGYYTFIPANAVAMNYAADGTLSGTYDTFSAAVSNATDGTTIRMCDDCDVSECQLNEDKSIRLDLNGKILTKKANGLFNVYGSLTILDESASQSGTFSTNNAEVADIKANATLNIIGGNFITSAYNEIFYNLGTINIYGGKFSYHAMLSRNKEGFSMSVYGGFFNRNTIYVSLETEETKKYYWNKYIADGFMEIDNSGITDYPYTVAPIGASLTYGNGNTANAPIYNGLTLDLNDDASDHDAWVSKIDVKKDIENIGVTVKKNFANTNWQAFYAPFKIDVTAELLQNFEVAKIWDTELDPKDNSTLIEFIPLKDGGSIPAFTPCLIKAKTTGKQDIEFKNVTVYANATKSVECSNVEESFTFTGVMENTPLTGCYALDSETGILTKIDDDNTDAQVTPMKFFMTVVSKTPATSIKSKKFAVRVIGDETTGISTVDGGNTAKTDGTVYNLQGVKVGTSLNGLPAGLYIQNGRKVVVK